MMQKYFSKKLSLVSEQNIMKHFKFRKLVKWPTKAKTPRYIFRSFRINS